jgi:YtkA-like
MISPACCFQVNVAGSPEATKTVKGPTFRVELVQSASPLQAHVPTRITFKVLDKASGLPITGLKDARALIFQPPGTWQQRKSAIEIGAGVYVVEPTFPRAGLYTLMFAAASRGIGFIDLPPTEFAVGSNR